jgi:hypothetical protein
MWLSCIKAKTGNDIYILHKYFKGKYLVPETKYVFGKTIVSSPSTASLDSKQFYEYMESIRMEMRDEQGIDLPKPGDQVWDQFYFEYGIK